MNTTVELILDDGDREPGELLPYADRSDLFQKLSDRLRSERARPEVVAVAARHEGGEVRVYRMRARQKPSQTREG